MSTILDGLSLALLLAAGGTLPPVQNCPPCSIEVRERVRLGAIADPVGLDMATQVAKTSRGDYVAAPVLIGPAVMLFSGEDGRLLRYFDATGGGPRELNGTTTQLLARGSSVFVVSPGRILPLSQEDLRPVGDVITTGLGSPSDIAALPGDRFVLSQPIRVSPEASAVLHIIDRNGALVSSIDRYAASPEDRSLRRALSADGDSFWTMTVADSRLELRAANDGSLIRVAEIERSWFEPWTGRLESPFRVKRQGQTIGISPLSRDQVAVISTRGDANWDPSAREPALRPSSTLDGVLDWVLEIADVQSGRVLASRVFDGRLEFVSSARGEVVRMSVDEATGHTQAVIYGLHIVHHR